MPNIESHLVWNPGKRAFVGRESEKFSNDDERMLHVVENGLYAKKLTNINDTESSISCAT